MARAWPRYAKPSEAHAASSAGSCSTRSSSAATAADWSPPRATSPTRPVVVTVVGSLRRVPRREQDPAADEQDRGQERPDQQRPGPPASGRRAVDDLAGAVLQVGAHAPAGVRVSETRSAKTTTLSR